MVLDMIETAIKFMKLIMEMEMEGIITIALVNYYSKVNIRMEKDGKEMEKNIIIMIK